VIRALRFPDATTMHEAMCRRLMLGATHGKDWDWTYGTEVGLHNVMIGCESFDWNYDLKRLWMPPSRWTMMVRQYIDPNDLADWKVKVADRLTGKGRGIAVLRTRTVQGRGAGKGVRRRWGSCMLSMSYRTNPVPTVTLHSRTTYFGYLAAMDITVANAFAWEASQITGINVEDMQFVWNLELAQFHGFRSLAWPLSDPELKARMDADVDNRFAFSAKVTPGYRKALDGYERILKSDRAGKLYGDEAFSSFARVRRRFHTEIMGRSYGNQFIGGSLNRGGKGTFPPLPSLPTDSLDFSVLANGTPTGNTDDVDYGFFDDDDA
jgi:hypothetical protein